MKNQNVEHVDSLRMLNIHVCALYTYYLLMFEARICPLNAGLSLDTRIEDVEEKFESAHLHFLAGAEDRIKKTKDLAKKDEEYLKIINIKERSIDRLVNSIKHMEVRLKSKVAEGASDTCKLKEERDNIRLAIKHLKVGHFLSAFLNAQ